MALDVYRKKRNFRNTPEPRGKVTSSKPHPLSFVIQKHAARRLHYDFRLELNGVLLSWAVPKGPSLDPADKRLAIHVEDHPLEYGGFEGVIPPKQYGSGTVMVWDRGTWTPKEDPERGYRAGRLKFQLNGQKLNGGWMLVRGHGSRYGGKAGDKAWLLIKENDAFAQRGESGQVVDAAPESALSGRSLDEIGRVKDRVWQSNVASTAPANDSVSARNTKPWRRAKEHPGNAQEAGAADASQLRGAKRARCPASLAPMLATLVKSVPSGDEWLHEMKYDGYRMLTRIDASAAHVYSRNGRDWTHAMSAVAADARRLPTASAWLDGEVAVITDDGHTSFQALQNALDASRSVQLTYFVFDLLYLDGFDLRGVALIERKRLLAHLLRSAPAGLRFSDHVVGSGEKFLAEACRLKLEGVVSKRVDSVYVAARSREWLKVKCSRRQELVIGGFTDPRRSRTGLGALLLGVHERGGGLRYAGKVGTGFDQASLNTLREKLEHLEQDSAPFDNPPKGFAAKSVHWVRPELVAEVGFAEWTNDGTLRQASFKGLREDKNAAEVVREHAVHTRDKAQERGHRRPAQPRSTRQAAHSIAGIALSNPDKLLYKDAKLSKLDIARYYEAIGPWIVPHLKNRPLSLVRCPDGWDGECFYQKHADKSVDEAVERVTVPEGNGHATYMMTDSAAAIVALVQLGVLELHPWGARTPSLDRPDRLVLDFDPDDAVRWDALVEAVSVARSLLAELGLTAFLKTTGGKGLHVVLPIRATLSWDQAKQFTKSVADLLVTTFPQRFVASAAKAKRKGKIFIDYLRNAEGATAVCAFSLRARAGAPVATPIAWDELERDVRFDHFNLRNVPERLERLKTDPWVEFFSLKQTVTRSVLKRLRVPA